MDGCAEARAPAVLLPIANMGVCMNHERLGGWGLGIGDRGGMRNGGDDQPGGDVHERRQPSRGLLQIHITKLFNNHFQGY
jgi:hypothetical protein